MKGTEKHTKIRIEDKKKFNAHHRYSIWTTNAAKEHLLTINFQKGPIKENGVNGIHHEDLIAIVIDRLESFQESEYACEANEMAIKYLDETLSVLRQRTDEREERGVEGTSEI